MRFDQARYWATRGNQYKAEFARHGETTREAFRRQEVEVRHALGEYDLSDVRTVIEVGCGFGRLTPVLLDRLPNVQSYTGLDVSAGQIEAARGAFPGGPEADFVVGDFRKLELEPADLVFAGEVFLHFPPDEVGGVVSRALALGRVLIHLDPYIPLPGLSLRERAIWTLQRARGRMPLQRTDWQHDYPRLYRERTVTIHPILNGSQHLFVVR